MKNLLKFSFFTLFSGNLLFAAPIDFSKFDFNSGSPKIDVQSLNNEKTTENSTVTTKYSTYGKTKTIRDPRTVSYEDGQVIPVHVAYGETIKVVFPGYIEGVEWLKRVGGIEINEKDLKDDTRPTDTLLITRTEDIVKDSAVFINLLGKRIILNIKCVKDNGDTLVKIDFPNNNVTTQNNQKQNIFNEPTGNYQQINQKDLTKQMVIKSTQMIIDMKLNRAKDNYSYIDLREKPKKDDGFFSSKDKEEESVSQLAFKQIFSGNKEFIESYRTKKFIPLELYKNSYTVVKSNKNITTDMTIWGLKLLWCNILKETTLTINIDKIKQDIGKTLLAAEHPMNKITPGQCVPVYVTFYQDNK